MTNVVDSINRRTMDSAGAAEEYLVSQSLNRAEKASLDRVRQEARGKPILDLGVGPGRTINALREVSHDYLGIDYSETMLAAARARYPGVKLEYADARDLRMLRDGSIFLAMFSCNGMGMVAHDDRLQIMREVFRVLRPGGVFLFSTNNQNGPGHGTGFHLPEFEPSANPARLVVRAVRFARDTVVRILNRRRFRKHDVRTPEYSIINDACHNYGTMLYHITLANQRKQLERIGFAANAEAYDRGGELIVDDSRESTIAFVARKPG